MELATEKLRVRTSRLDFTVVSKTEAGRLYVARLCLTVLVAHLRHRHTVDRP